MSDGLCGTLYAEDVKGKKAGKDMKYPDVCRAEGDKAKRGRDAAGQEKDEGKCH